MNHWNYRIVQSDVVDSTEYEICEVYYDKDGKPIGYCSASIAGDTAEELREVFERMKSAFEKPVLTEKEMISDRT